MDKLLPIRLPQSYTVVRREDLQVTPIPDRVALERFWAHLERNWSEERVRVGLEASWGIG